MAGNRDYRRCTALTTKGKRCKANSVGWESVCVRHLDASDARRIEHFADAPYSGRRTQNNANDPTLTFAARQQLSAKAISLQLPLAAWPQTLFLHALLKASSEGHEITVDGRYFPNALATYYSLLILTSASGWMLASAGVRHREPSTAGTV